MKDNESLFDDKTNKKFDNMLREMVKVDIDKEFKDFDMNFNLDMDFDLFKDDDIKE